MAIVTSGRFWLIDLARELLQLGWPVTAYSAVPPWVVEKQRLPLGSHRWLGPLGAVAYGVIHRVPSGSLRDSWSEQVIKHLDARATDLLEDCDILIGLSGLSVRCLERARRAYGATIFLERGSRHVASQSVILRELHGSTAHSQVPRWALERELRGYELADRITVPSRHVADSFLENSTLGSKIFRNPFGVSTDVFLPTRAPNGPRTIVMTGAWSRRKGCHDLLRAWRSLDNVRLLHVGPVVDLPLPVERGFEHVDAVPQRELARYYAEADVFALASYEEGLALVQVQALASGLQIICSDRTGGEDLKEWCLDPSVIRVFPHGDVAALREQLSRGLAAADVSRRSGGVRDLLGENREHTSWSAYARRYALELERSWLERCAPRPKGPSNEPIRFLARDSGF